MHLLMVFFLYVQEEPRDVSTAVDDLPHTETGGKKADRLQRDVDPKLRVSSKGRGPAPQRHIPTHAPPKRKTCLHHASYTCRVLPDYTYALNRKPLRLNRFHWRWRRLEENELGLFRRPLHARLGPGRGVMVSCLFVSQIFQENSWKFLRNFLEILRNFLKIII